MRSNKTHRSKDKGNGKTSKKSESVSSLQSEDDEALAVLCSCIHLSHLAPIARSVEDDWYGVMKGYLKQLKAVAAKHKVSIICCGDVFDKPDAPPELISFAIEHLPHMYAIPGQHDLPHHNYDDLHKSAYWTLVKAGNIINLEIGMNYIDTITTEPWWIAAFPWGFTDDIPNREKGDEFVLAVAHAYCWKSTKNSYPGAPPSKHVEKWQEKFKGYNAVALGDNHRGFISIDGPVLFNCGTLLRRKADEIDYKPRVGVVYRSGKIETHFLESEDDKFIDIDDACQVIEKALDATDFLEELSTMVSKIVDFAEAVERFCSKNNISKRVQSVLSKAMEIKK